MSRTDQTIEACRISVRFAQLGDRDRFVIDLRTTGAHSVEIDYPNDVDLHLRVPSMLRRGVLGLLFVHGGQVIADDGQGDHVQSG